MKKIILVTAGCATLLLGVAFAQDEHAHFQASMKTAAAASGALRKNVTDKDAPQTSTNAQKLVDVFTMVQAHFEEDHIDDGVTFAKTGHKAAMDLIAAANAGDWDKASEQLKTIGGTCQGCHAAHREKLPDGTFRMKH
jgi:cytochrome c556